MWADLRQASRGVRLALAAIAIVSLALGIGANVTIFSVVREMVLDDVSASAAGSFDARARLGIAAEANYRDLSHAGVFDGLAFDTGFGNQIWNTGTHGEVVWRMGASANFFDVLGVTASAGRLFFASRPGSTGRGSELWLLAQAAALGIFQVVGRALQFEWKALHRAGRLAARLIAASWATPLRRKYMLWTILRRTTVVPSGGCGTGSRESKRDSRWSPLQPLSGARTSPGK